MLEAVFSMTAEVKSDLYNNVTIMLASIQGILWVAIN